MKYIIAIIASQVLALGIIVASTGPRGGAETSTGPRGGEIVIRSPGVPHYQSPYWYRCYNARMEFDPADEKR